MKRGLLILTAVLAACATLEAPSQRDERPAGVDETAGLSLEVTEGRPQGVALRISVDDGAPECRMLAVFRLADHEAMASMLQEIPLDDALRRQLADGVELVDRSVKPGRTFEYVLVGLDHSGAVQRRSEQVTVAWHRPPPRPNRVEARAPFTDVVELSWDGPPGVGAVVFRRDVLDKEGRFTRVAELESSSGAWVDRRVAPGGVWSYRVALASRHGEIVQYGPPSEEVYASTPEARE